MNFCLLILKHYLAYGLCHLSYCLYVQELSYTYLLTIIRAIIINPTTPNEISKVFAVNFISKERDTPSSGVPQHLPSSTPGGHPLHLSGYLQPDALLKEDILIYHCNNSFISLKVRTTSTVLSCHPHTLTIRTLRLRSHHIS